MICIRQRGCYWVIGRSDDFFSPLPFHLTSLSQYFNLFEVSSFEHLLLLTSYLLLLTPPRGEYRIRTPAYAKRFGRAGLTPVSNPFSPSGGEYRIRTDDPLLAKQVL